MSFTSIEKRQNSMPYTSIENKRRTVLTSYAKNIWGRGEAQLIHVEDLDTAEEIKSDYVQ